MRVLMLTPSLPQPTGSGAAIRNWSILRFLVEGLGARVQVMTFGGAGPAAVEPLPPGVDVAALAAPERPWRRRLAALARSPLPDLADRLWLVEAQARVVWQALRSDVDVVHIGGLELARYGLEIARQRASTGGPALVLDEYNAEYRLQQRAFQTDLDAPARWPAAAYSAEQWRRLRAFERRVLLAVDAVVCVSLDDAAALRALAGDIDPTIIPNGVDPDRYAPAEYPDPGWPRHDLVFSGTFDYRPNVDAAVWFASTIWPALRERRPSLSLALVGQRPAPAVQALARRPGVVVTGGVPDDRPFLWGAGVYVVPMRYGGGVRLKLLNALAAGCPVVSTTMGAEGTAVVDGRDLLLADRLAEWVQGVPRLLDDAALRARLVTAGRRLVREQYDWRRLVPAFEAVYAAATERVRSRQSPVASRQ